MFLISRLNKIRVSKVGDDLNLVPALSDISGVPRPGQQREDKLLTLNLQQHAELCLPAAILVHCEKLSGH